MGVSTFFVLFGLIAVAWVIQGAALHFTTIKLGFPGAGIRKTIKVTLLLVLALIVVGLVFGLISAFTSSLAISMVSSLAPLGASAAVVHYQYKERFTRTALLVAMLAIMGLASVSIIRATFAQAFEIPSASMAPALERGDIILASKFAYRTSGPARGDIVVFESPQDQNVRYVKRVIGLPGETIEIEDGVLSIDGVRVDDIWGVYLNEPDPSGRNPIQRSPASTQGDDFGPVVVPDGQYFVLGDNRNYSMDSRRFGTVPRELLIGKVAMRYWPVSRWGEVQ